MHRSGEQQSSGWSTFDCVAQDIMEIVLILTHSLLQPFQAGHPGYSQ